MKTETGTPCRRCGARVFYVYASGRKCAACASANAKSLQQQLIEARQQNENLRHTLRVLDTWARFDETEGRPVALTPADVMAICGQHL